MFIPEWGVWIGSILIMLLVASVFFLRKQVGALEEHADGIEEIQEAQRKGRT